MTETMWPDGVHFGIKVPRSKYGPRLDRSKYAIPPNSARAATWPREGVARQIEDALENYDLNMAWFSHLDRDEFQISLDGILADNPEFEAVDDLNHWDVPGVYIMVLDEYKQMYIGESGDKLRMTAVTKGSVRRRIREHWARVMPFERLIFGTVGDSILSIDSFRAYDTTRIYARHVPDADSGLDLERKVEEAIPDRFRLNRIPAGGIDSGLGELHAAAIRYSRNLRSLAPRR